MSIENAINVWVWEGSVLASISIAVLLGLAVHKRYAARKEPEMDEHTRRMEELTSRRLAELEKSTVELEGKARTRRMWADTAKQMLRGFPFVAAGFLLAMSHDHMAILAGIFLGLGGWLTMLSGL